MASTIRSTSRSRPSVVRILKLLWPYHVSSDGVALPTCNGMDGLSAANHYRAVARYGATPLFLGGAALVGYAIYVYVTIPTAPAKPDRDRDRDRLGVAPVVGSDQAGVAVFGRF